MDLQNVAIGLGGILVSILTFAAGYRQTIGAKQIRISASNEALVETFLRVIVIEQLDVSADDIETAINGTAAKIGVPSESLRNGVQLAEVIHHQILASDLINKSDRERAIGVLASLRKDLAPHPLMNSGKRARRHQRALYVVLGLAVATSLLGVAVVSIVRPDESLSSSDLLVQFGLAMAAALSIAGFLTFRYGRLPIYKEPQTAHPALREYLLYPDEVEGPQYLRILQSLSPFAVRNLFQLGQDEIRSMKYKAIPGMAGNPQVNLGLQELIDKRLALRIGKSKRNEAEDMYGLTAQGRAVSRLLQPSVERSTDKIPNYLLPFAAPDKARAEQADEGFEGGALAAPVEGDEPSQNDGREHVKKIQPNQR